MKFVIQALQLSLSLILLSACGGGGESGGAGNPRVSLNNVSVMQSEVAVSSVHLVNESAPILLQWNVSFSSITNLYSMTITAESDTGAAKRLLYQNCSQNAGALYNCGTTGNFECQVSENKLNCEINGIGSAPFFSSSFDAISFEACVYGNALDEICDEKRLSVGLLIASDNGASGPGDGAGDGPGDGAGDGPGDGAGDGPGDGPGAGAGSGDVSVLLPGNVVEPDAELRSDLIPPMPLLTD